MPTDPEAPRGGDVVLRALPDAAGGGAAFAIEVGGEVAGRGRVLPSGGRPGSQVALQLAGTGWPAGIAEAAIRLLTGWAFAAGADVRDVFALGVAGDEQGAFRACRYVPWWRSSVAGRWDLLCRRDHFEGRAAAVPHTAPDGVRAADEPHGAMVVVYRRAPALEVLLLHRAGLGEAEDWAWTPPAGARFPAEPPDECAARELHEETGLDAPPTRLAGAGTARWWVYALEVGADAVIGGGDEHDGHAWLPAAEAARRCRPEVVRASVLAAVAHLAV